MTVVGGDNDQRVLATSGVQCSLNRRGKFHCIAQGGEGTVGMVTVINASGFDHQEKTLLIVVEDIDSLGGHLGERGLSCKIIVTIGLIAHLRLIKETEQILTTVGINSVKTRLINHVVAPGIERLPLFHKIATIVAVALYRAAGVAAIGCRVIG